MQTNIISKSTIASSKWTPSSSQFTRGNVSDRSLTAKVASWLLVSLSVVVLGSSSALAVGATAIENYLPKKVTLSESSKDQLAAAVMALMAADPKNSPANIAEAVKSVSGDRERINTILTTAVRFLKGEFEQSAGTSKPAVSDGKSVAKEGKGVVYSEAFDCAKVLDIWTLSAQAAPAMDQWIIEIGMREAPECFTGTISESFTESGTVYRSISTNTGLNGASNSNNSKRKKSSSGGGGSGASGGGGGTIEQ